MAEDFERRRRQGQVKAHGSGFGGSGFKFDKGEDEAKKAQRKAQVKEAGVMELSDEEGDSDGDEAKGTAVRSVATAPAPGAAAHPESAAPPATNVPPHIAAQMAATRVQAAARAVAQGMDPMRAAAQAAAPGGGFPGCPGLWRDR